MTKSEKLIILALFFRRFVKKIIIEKQNVNFRINKIRVEIVNCLQKTTKIFIIEYLSSKCIILMHYFDALLYFHNFKF